MRQASVASQPHSSLQPRPQQRSLARPMVAYDRELNTPEQPELLRDRGRSGRTMLLDRIPNFLHEIVYGHHSTASELLRTPRRQDCDLLEFDLRGQPRENGGPYKAPPSLKLLLEACFAPLPRIRIE